MWHIISNSDLSELVDCTRTLVTPTIITSGLKSDFFYSSQSVEPVRTAILYTVYCKVSKKEKKQVKPQTILLQPLVGDWRATAIWPIVMPSTVAHAGFHFDTGYGTNIASLLYTLYSSVSRRFYLEILFRRGLIP